MKTNKITPIAAFAVLLGLSGAMIATAQTIEQTTTTEEAPVEVRQTRDGDHDRRHGRGEGRGDGMGELMRGAFEQADANADGSVTAEELTAFRTAKVTAADTNADGNLSLDEFRTVWLDAMEPRLVDAFQHADADGDGAITAAEIDDMSAKVIERLDRNGDGVINQDDRRRGNRG